MRIGIGIDFHRFVKGRGLIIGGVTIPYKLGLKGHSDADVLLHAICDAMLGACGLGDIGELFPDADPKFKDISSLKLLEDVNTFIRKKGYKVNNIDSVLICEAPKISSYKQEMKKKISEVLEIGIDRVNIKATTAEGMGALGRKEGISAQAVALLE